MAEITSSLFSRNTLPSTIPNFVVNKPPTNNTNVSGNLYTNLNVTQDPNKVTNAANTLAGTLDSPIQGLKDLSTMKVDTSGAPDTSMKSAIDRINTVASGGVTKDTLNKFSSLRPENEYESKITPALSRLEDYASGDSKVDRTIANRYLTKFDASSASANIAQAQRIASNPYLTTGAKQAAAAELNRTAASQRSELTGELAEKAQERAFTAAKEYATLTLDAANFKENQYKTDLAAATQEVTNNLNAAIAAGNLQSEEITNNISIWNSKLNAQMNDMNRSLDALMKSGQLTADQARIKMDGILESSRIEGQNITNGLLKAKGIAEYAGQEANIKQIDAAIAKTQNEIYKSNNALATESILSYREKWQGTDKDNADEAINDPVIRQKLENTWKSIPGNEGIPMSEDWAKYYYNGISTAAEISTQTTTNILKELEKTFVGEGPGKMSKEAFDNFANNMRMINDLGGTLRMSADGKSIYMVDASGKPMTDNNNSAYAWNVADGSRATVIDSTKTEKDTFDKWREDTLYESDTKGYDDRQVFDAYKSIINKGETPTADKVLAALKSSAGGTIGISKVDIDNITNKLINSGANTGTLTSGTNIFDNIVEIDLPEVKKIIDYESANPNDVRYSLPIDLSTGIDENVSARSGSGRSSEWYNLRDNMTTNIGKIISLNGNKIIPLGLKDYNTFKYYDTKTGKIDTRDIAIVLYDSARYNKYLKQYANADETGKTKIINEINGLDLKKSTKDDLIESLKNSSSSTK